MKKSIIYHHKGKDYRAVVVPECFGRATVNFYERRTLPSFGLNPNILYWHWVDSMGFWVEDYESIEAGCRAKFAKLMKEEEERIAVAKKWEEFNKNY